MLVLFSLTSLVCNYGNSNKLFSIVHAVLFVSMVTWSSVYLTVSLVGRSQLEMSSCL